MQVVTTARGVFSPQSERWALNEGAEWIASALRADDLPSAEHTLAHRAVGLGIDDAVLGREELHRVPWTTEFATPGRRDVLLLEGAKPSRFVGHLENELHRRGVHTERVSGGDVSFSAAGELTVAGQARAMPEAVFPTAGAVRHLGVLDEFDAAGAHVVNRARAVLAGRDKNEMARIWSTRDDVATPTSIPDVRTPRALLQAADDIGYPVVLKQPRGAMGIGVATAASPEEVLRVAAGWGIAPGAPPPDRGLLVQAQADFGREDGRTYYALDAATGQARIVAATHRVSMGEDIRANGGDQGNMIRPVLDLSGGDAYLGQDLIDVGMRAGLAARLEWWSADVARDAATGKATVIEVDNYAHPVEANHPVPREQQVFPHLADLLQHGS